MRISDWSSDVCPSDLPQHQPAGNLVLFHHLLDRDGGGDDQGHARIMPLAMARRAFQQRLDVRNAGNLRHAQHVVDVAAQRDQRTAAAPRSEEHTSELQSLMRISYAVFCLKKKKLTKHETHNKTQT